MTTITLIPASEGSNGIIAKKSRGAGSNSIELHKVSLSGRDNGCIAVVAGSTFNIIPGGSSWRTFVNNPRPEISLQNLVADNKAALNELLN